uniref:Uncharacterized deoxyribodipyrimidine photolyase-like protein n=1 Tax=Polynucleobacter necessarius subsp. necessarius (strain STIR1) TaxID=452638 RepID=B1XVL7_POLNS
MVTGNFALLAEILPQEACEWYLAIYVDAIEWVELPNTAGMALFANGGRFTSKPYIASGAYIKRMSNYCGSCKYQPEVRYGEEACPITTLYWNFLIKHRDQFEASLLGFGVLVRMLYRRQAIVASLVRNKPAQAYSCCTQSPWSLDLWLARLSILECRRQSNFWYAKQPIWSAVCSLHNQGCMDIYN